MALQARQRRREASPGLLRFASLAILGAAVASCAGSRTARPADEALSFWAHSVTPLQGDVVLIAGGYGQGGESTSAAWLYHPSDGSFEPADPMAVRRAGHTATLLADGRVLVVGGCDFGTPGNTFTSSAELNVFSAEVYDRATGRWTRTGDLRFGRCDHTATLLPSGKVLVVGGDEADPCGIPELFDPATGRWEMAGQLETPRSEHAAVLLTDGTVMVVGGVAYLGAPIPPDLCTRATGSPEPVEPSAAGTGTMPPLILSFGGRLSSVEIYEPTTGAWREGPPMSSKRDGPSATVLRDGRVLVAGGFDEGMLATAEIFDPTDGRWHPATSMSGARGLHSATLLVDGSVLVAGGCAFHCTSTAERYDPARDLWSPTGSMGRAKRNDPGILMPDGRVLVVHDPAAASAETFDPETETWNEAGQ